MTSGKETVFFSKGIIAGIIGIIIVLVILLIFMMPSTPTGSETSKKIAESIPAKEPVKTSRPVVNLYVMSFCPYGTQAETILQPVYDLLGSKTDIRIRYLTTVTGATIDSVKSLHGITEVEEDAFQACLGKSSPATYREYLRKFNEQCYPVWKNGSALDTCRSNVTASLQIDQIAIETCSTGAEGIALLKSDEMASLTDGASASPTLVINGQVFTGTRSPEAYKKAICNSFESEPEECKTVLPDSFSSSTSGGCG
jgi:glutaredoxin